MTPRNNLEIKGNFLAHPFAELVAEIAQARLNGSLRLASKEKKCVLYFRSGRIAFAVSNARASRLFAVLLRTNKLTREELTAIPNFENDLELAAFVQDKQVLSKEESDRLFVEQIDEIILDIFSWPAGDWTFSSLTRVRDGLAFEIDMARLLVNYGRCLSVEVMLGRFRSLDETFDRSALPEIDVGLKPEEAFVLSRADEGPLSASDLVSVAAMSESAALHSIYTLWLGGLLIRNDWQPAFSEAAIKAMNGAKLEVKKEAKWPGVPAGSAKEQKVPEAVTPAAAEPEISLSLDEYLARIESAQTHYDILGVDGKADIDELKRAYFSLAKSFHPDRYHADGGDILKRVQHAFTELAQAHETLKSPETREIYDYRMRKELAEREKRTAAGNLGNHNLHAEQGAENFERGFGLLMEDRADAALQFLARAVHYDTKNARYHAYYGKALSADANQRHKAEAEMQAAVKLDTNNPTFRIILAEFFIQFNLLKRAEGELNRLLVISPGNREALNLLEKLAV